MGKIQELKSLEASGTLAEVESQTPHDRDRDELAGLGKKQMLKARIPTWAIPR